jgi:hypothetical protein
MPELRGIERRILQQRKSNKAPTLDLPLTVEGYSGTRNPLG